MLAGFFLKVPTATGQDSRLRLGMTLGAPIRSRTNIGRILCLHLTGQSGNYGIMNYAARYQARFTYHSFQLLRNLGAAAFTRSRAFSSATSFAFTARFRSAITSLE